MKKVFYVLIICAVLMMVALSAQASVTMWLTDASGVDIGAPGSGTWWQTPNQAFAVQIWMTTTEVNQGFTVALGYDTSTFMGKSSTLLPIDNKITLATGVTDADIAWGSEMASLYPTATAPIVGGLRNLSGSATSSVRPFGLQLARAGSNVGALTTATLIATVNLKNLMNDGTYGLRIWDANQGSTYTSVINLGGGKYSRASDNTLTVAVPEPSSMIALGSGVLGLLGLIRRRRA